MEVDVQEELFFLLEHSLTHRHTLTAQAKHIKNKKNNKNKKKNSSFNLAVWERLAANG